MKTALFFLCALACAAPARAYDIDSLVKELAARPGIRNASWGVSVKDAATGKVIVERDAQKNLAPASILKIFVTAAAFDLLGPEHKVKTGIYYDGRRTSRRPASLRSLSRPRLSTCWAPSIK